MKIQYKSKRCQSLCEDIRQAKKCLPAGVAEKLTAHINYIKAAHSFVDVINYPPFQCHKLVGDRKNYFALDVGRKLGYRIIVDPQDENGISLKDEKDFEIIKRCTAVVLVVEVTNHYA